MSIHFSNLSDDISEVTSSTHEWRGGVYHRHLKRLFEVVTILVTSFVTVPVVLILALLVALDGSAPFFRQRRVGLNGIVFDIWKLRTMVPDAEMRLQACLAEDPKARAEWDATQKLKDDPKGDPNGSLSAQILAGRVAAALERAAR